MVIFSFLMLVLFVLIQDLYKNMKSSCEVGMENLLDKILDTAKYVSDRATFVKINYQKLDEVVDSFDSKKISFWLESNPFNILDMDYKEIINFLLVYHTIGDYCFWGDPKWTVDCNGRKLDGSYAVMYLLVEHLKSNKGFKLSFDEFSQLLKGNVEIPLLEDRYNNLVVMNKFLEEKNSSFYDLIKNFHTDYELFNYLIKNFKYFKDESLYDDKIIYFYKRAQLLTSDILHVRKMFENIDVDYSHLVGCADYKIPQVMRCMGILEFNSELVDMVDNMILLDEGSKMEIEIRTCDIIVIDYISKKIGNSITRMDINDYIWLLGQDKKKITKPYHRTLTNHY